eukprot:NODE_1061_length_2387_cov_0.940559.p2 type:complete len:286 gc:universal NODE_1061_length_2387_cov_0.940559:1816-959(-)
MNFNFIRFNQDHSICAITTTSGFILVNIDPFGTFYTSQMSATIIELLYNTSLLAIAHLNQVTIKNIKRDSIIGELKYKDVVKDVRMNRQYLMISADNQIFIYGMNDLKLIQKIELKSTALIRLLDTWLIYAVKNTLTLFNINNLTPLFSIVAHQSDIHQLYCTNEFIFTCSERGTIIRQYSLSNGELNQEFRRGLTAGKINDLHFNGYLVVSSENTVHFYTQNSNTNLTSMTAVVDTSFYLHPTLKIKNGTIGHLNEKWVVFDSEGTLWVIQDQTVIDKKSLQIQ